MSAPVKTTQPQPSSVPRSMRVACLALVLPLMLSACGGEQAAGEEAEQGV